MGLVIWGWPLTPLSLPAPDLVSLWSRGCSCLASTPGGRVCGPAPVPPLLGASLKLSQLCTSLRNNLFKHVILPAIVGERHCRYLHTEGVEAALYPQVWLRPKSMLFALLPPHKVPTAAGATAAPWHQLALCPLSGAVNHGPTRRKGSCEPGGDLGPQTPEVSPEELVLLELCPPLGSGLRGGW